MMLEIVPFEEKYLTDAGRILAARHKFDRSFIPQLPEQFEGITCAIAHLQVALNVENTSTVVALKHDRVVGFLSGRVRFAPPGSATGFSWHPRSVSMPFDSQAVEPEFCREAYGAMYAVLSQHWLEAGLFSHYVFLSAQNQQAIASWFSLGFGQNWTYAIRNSDSMIESNSSFAEMIEIGLAESEERERILYLLDDLYRHHAVSPCYLPYVFDTAVGFRADNAKAFDDPNTINWVARYNGNIVGVLVANLPLSAACNPTMGKPEHCPYIHLLSVAESMRGKGVGTTLVNRMLTWAQENGYLCCSVEWHTANLSAALFWERCGFISVRQALTRHIDERIAWANGRK